MKRSWTDQLKHTGELFSNFWRSKSSKQKGLIIGTFLFFLIVFSAFIFFASRPQYVPLYTGQLTQREVGDIKAELDKQGYMDFKLSDTGTMLLVPKKDAPDLLVSLASSGFPKDNKINYDIFGENLSFGATDRQYDILEKEAMQNQLAKVIGHIAGIKSAEVILTLPEDTVFIKQDQDQAATASVMVEVEPGVQLDSAQIRALYTLVSRSVQNLPVENITIMNQYSETLALEDSNNDGQAMEKYDEQRKIQQNIERDIQQSLQNLLGTMLGTDKVYVHSYVKMNFDKVKTQENLVKPAEDSKNGLPVSSEKSSVTSSGNGSGAGGVVGTGETDVPGYVGGETAGESNYEESNEKVNYELNRINNEIIKSPYQIEDITINVGVESNPETPNAIAPEVQESIQNIVANTVRTALGHPTITQEEIEQRVTIFPHTFAKNNPSDSEPTKNSWLVIVGAIAAALLLGGGILWWVLKRKKENQEQETEEEISFSLPNKEPDYFAEQDMGVESQLRKLLEQRPEDFSKVIRTWLNEEEE
jgi:flagellar M-ring protein FliF